MSWIVETYLRNYKTYRRNSKEYDDVVSIDMSINSLLKMGQLTEYDIAVIDLTKEGFSASQIAIALDKSKWGVLKTLKRVCNRIAFDLGGRFTDDGYLLFLRERYHLTDDEVTRARAYMHGRYRNRLLRKGTNYERKDS